MTQSSRSKSQTDKFHRACIVAPKTAPGIGKRNASDTLGLTRETADAGCAQLGAEFAELQELLYAARDHSLLIVLQGMDTSGKDGTIKNVMDPVNPTGVRVSSFKVPTEEELGHDFLWRIHQKTPERGTIGIFNRSHYEDVLVVRVKKLVPAPVWKRRFRSILEFERQLVESKTIVLKFFLHISHDEQEERLLAREQDTSKAWKLNTGDWKDRVFWKDYIAAYEDAISKTSTGDAPWYVVPANKKWARNYIVMSLVAGALRPYRQAWLDSLSALGRKRLEEIAELRESK